MGQNLPRYFQRLEGGIIAFSDKKRTLSAKIPH